MRHLDLLCHLDVRQAAPRVVSGFTRRAIAALITVGVLWLSFPPDRPEWGMFLGGLLVVAIVVTIYDVTYWRIRDLTPGRIVDIAKTTAANPIRRRTIRRGVLIGLFMLAFSMPVGGFIFFVRYMLLILQVQPDALQQYFAWVARTGHL